MSLEEDEKRSEEEMTEEAQSEKTQEATQAQGSPAVPALKVILASKSPRRVDLLRDAGVKFSVRVPQEPVDEALNADELAFPVEAAKKLAEKKAGAVVQELLAENSVGMFAIIGADTMVVLDGQIYGKPRNLDDAKRMLGELSAKTHDVITAVSLWMIAAASPEDISLAYRTFADLSKVTFKELSDEQIADYLRKGESFDKAGAYAIQGAGADLVEKYDGNLDTIIGLPVQHLVTEFPDLVSAQ